MTYSSVVDSLAKRLASHRQKKGCLKQEGNAVAEVLAEHFWRADAHGHGATSRRWTAVRRIGRSGLAWPKDKCLVLATRPAHEAVYVRPAALPAFRQPL